MLAVAAMLGLVLMSAFEVVLRARGSAGAEGGEGLMSDPQTAWRATPGTITNIQHYSIHDGPGIRTTVFFQGCPLGCWWCQNPETRLGPGRSCSSTWRSARAAGNACRSVRIRRSRLATAVPSRIGCAATVRDGAPRSVRPEGPLDHGQAGGLRERSSTKPRADAMFYAEGEGGITLSGGEPLSQPEFASALLELCRAEGLHTTVDTCGYAAWDVAERVCCRWRASCCSM